MTKNDLHVKAYLALLEKIEQGEEVKKGILEFARELSGEELVLLYGFACASAGVESCGLGCGTRNYHGVIRDGLKNILSDLMSLATVQGALRGLLTELEGVKGKKIDPFKKGGVPVSFSMYPIGGHRV